MPKTKLIFGTPRPKGNKVKVSRVHGLPDEHPETKADSPESSRGTRPYGSPENSSRVQPRREEGSYSETMSRFAGPNTCRSRNGEGRQPTCIRAD